MILGCPECATRFMVPDDALRPKGRNVKCGKCEHRWFADPPPDADDSDDSYEPVSVTPFDPEEQSPIPPRNLPAVPMHSSMRSTVAAWGLLVAMLVMLGSVLWFGRAQLVAAVPVVQPVYQKIGICVGIADPETSFRISGTSQPALAESGELVIEREVMRDNKCATYVPDIVVEFIDTKKNVLKRVRYPLGIAELVLGKPAPFALRIADWPDNIADINLFFTIPNVQS